MKKKKIMKFVMSLLLVFSLASPAMAEEKQIAIQLNGEWLPLTDSVPMLKEGRVFVPFRAVLEALEAEVSYNDECKEITAVKDERSLRMGIGNPVINLTIDETEAVVTTDAPSFIENGRTYVPVRFVAQALDCNVGWDSERQVVIILDMDKIAEKTAGSYQLMNDLQAYTQKITEKNYELQGKLSFAVTNEMEEKVLKAKVVGQSHPEAVKLIISVEPDTMSLAHTLLKEKGRLTTEGEDLLRALEKVEIDLFLDKKNEQVYLASDLMTILYGLNDTWYQLDLEALGVENSQQLWTVSDTEKIEALIEKLLNQLSLSDSVAVAADISSIFMLHDAYSDEQFKKSENSYLSAYKEELDGNSWEMITKILLRGQQINGYEIQQKYEATDCNFTLINKGENNSHSLVINAETGGEQLVLASELHYQLTDKQVPKPPQKYQVLSTLK